MSKEKRFKTNMSFEDMMKKAATTQVNPAIMIEGKGKEYKIPGAAGKRIQFVQIAIAERNIGDFLLRVVVTSPTENPQEHSIFLPLDPYQKRTDTVYISYPPVVVPINGNLVISVVSTTNEDFEVGSVIYKIL